LIHMFVLLVWKVGEFDLSYFLDQFRIFVFSVVNPSSEPGIKT
jgi:hypothetical protein